MVYKKLIFILFKTEDNSGSGSDSNPSEDELPDEDMITILPKCV